MYVCVCVFRCVAFQDIPLFGDVRFDWIGIKEAQRTQFQRIRIQRTEKRGSGSGSGSVEAVQSVSGSAAQRRAEQRSAACRVRRRGAHTDESDDTDEQLDARTREPRTRTSDTDMTRCYLLLPTPTRDSTPNSDFYSTLL